MEKLDPNQFIICDISGVKALCAFVRLSLFASAFVSSTLRAETFLISTRDSGKKMFAQNPCNIYSHFPPLSRFVREFRNSIYPRALESAQPPTAEV